VLTRQTIVDVVVAVTVVTVLMIMFLLIDLKELKNETCIYNNQNVVNNKMNLEDIQVVCVFYNEVKKF
jgi:hypothetical protein